MFTVVASVTLPYPPEAVFAALASVEGTVRWQAGVRGVWRARSAGSPPAADPVPAAPDAAPPDAAPPDAAPPEDGTPALVLDYWALGVRHRLRAHVTAHRPPELFAYRAAGDGMALDVTFCVAPVSVGRHVACHVACTVVLRERTSAPTAGDAAIGPTAPPPGAGAAAPDLVRLRRLLTRRLPRDLARLEAWVAVQPRAHHHVPRDPIPVG